jgi:hypothetical protein
MRTFILILGLFIVTNLNLFGIDLDSKNAITIEEIRKVRFMVIPREEYSLDTDRYIIGQQNILDNKKRLNSEKIKKENQQNLKFKSTYLDYTIISEENIS